jgi:hypothetical protein
LSADRRQQDLQHEVCDDKTGDGSISGGALDAAGAVLPAPSGHKGGSPTLCGASLMQRVLADATL